ncbi:MAG: 50S ribosomal protein L11 methyltransferase [Clostridia bacterium]|nr:50S ribosomal protein L11 methyltransferase [Clostridia bacterium]
MNDYNQIKVTVKHEDADNATAVMTAMDFFGGLMIEDFSDIDTCPWDYVDEELLKKDKTVVSISGYMETNENVLAVTEQLKIMLPQDAIVEVISVNEDDWANNWKKYYHPIRVGKNLVIKPSWIDYEKQENDIIVELDPGMAFGTGTHETTRMCMTHLEKYINKNSRVLDVGCGSGILSITSLLIGAKEVTGVDIDPVAVKVAIENGEMNNFRAPQYNIKRGNLVDEAQGKYDVIVANIIADVIIAVCGDVKQFVADDGVFISSGIICDRKEDVKKAFAEQGYTIVEELEEGEWVSFVCKK